MYILLCLIRNNPLIKTKHKPGLPNAKLYFADISIHQFHLKEL